MKTIKINPKYELGEEIWVVENRYDHSIKHLYISEIIIGIKKDNKITYKYKYSFSKDDVWGATFDFRDEYIFSNKEDAENKQKELNKLDQERRYLYEKLEYEKHKQAIKDYEDEQLKRMIS